MKPILLFLITVFTINCSHSAQTGSANNEERPQINEPNEPNDDRNVKYRFAVISDLNGSYGSKKYSKETTKAVDYIVDKKNEVNFVLSTGDMVAGQKSGLDYPGMWEAFHSKVTRRLLGANVPFYPSPGNHDAYINRKEERDHYKKSWSRENVFSIPQNFEYVKGVTQNFPFQYAFRVGPALFIALDDTVVKAWSETTLKWMDQIFKQEKNAKLKIVYGHIPILPFAFRKEREYVSRGNLEFLQDIEELFETHKVDMFLSGHSHVYYPGRRGLHTQYISVPLVGGGARYLLQAKLPEERAHKGFLVFEYNDKGQWKMEHRKANGYDLIDDASLPESIVMPSKEIGPCRYCTQFPDSHFIDPSKRVIYLRRDL